MRTIVSRLGCFTLLAALGCLPEGTTIPDAGAGAPTYTKDVQPIFAAKCSPCHAGQRQGFHDIATMYADAKKPVESLDSEHCWNDQGAPVMTMPKTVGECSLLLIESGRMPYLLQCAQFPLLDGCVKPAEHDLIARWVAAGMPQ
jgi:hypothetical protein